MIVYLHNKCSTCQKAVDFLEKNKIVFTVKNIVTDPPSVKELEKMLHFQNGKLSKLLNTSGLLYREMNLSKKLPDLTVDEVLTLLSTHGMLVKRPFLLTDSSGFVGFKESEWEKVFQSD